MVVAPGLISHVVVDRVVLGFGCHTQDFGLREILRIERDENIFADERQSFHTKYLIVDIDLVSLLMLYVLTTPITDNNCDRRLIDGNDSTVLRQLRCCFDVLDNDHGRGNLVYAFAHTVKTNLHVGGNIGSLQLTTAGRPSRICCTDP